MRSIRKNAVEGMFYPGSPGALKRNIADFLNVSEQTATAPVKMIIVPHAGYSYSGKIAGAAYSEITPERVENIMLLGPSHRHYFEGVAESMEDAWQTPFGTVDITHLNSPHIIRNAGYHKDEHCLEVQLPFIKYLMPDALVSPLLLSGDHSQAETIASQLQTFDSDGTLWIISSDFNHTGPNFRHIPEQVGYDSGKTMDQEAISLLTSGDINGFKTFLKRTRSTICGALPILVAMYLARSMNRQNFVFKSYDCSGDQTGDINSVGYGALYC